jgi:hypothetical protein
MNPSDPHMASLRPADRSDGCGSVYRSLRRGGQLLARVFVFYSLAFLWAAKRLRQGPLKADWRLVPAALYIALLGLFVGSIYDGERSAGPDGLVDANGLLIFLGLLTFFFGVAIGRWWAVLLPLVAFQFAVVATFVAAFDKGYTADRGDILAFATFFVVVFGIPPIVAGVGFSRLVAGAARIAVIRRRTE